jgi:hypothetical protein
MFATSQMTRKSQRAGFRFYQEALENGGDRGYYEIMGGTVDERGKECPGARPGGAEKNEKKPKPRPHEPRLLPVAAVFEQPAQAKSKWQDRGAAGTARVSHPLARRRFSIRRNADEP